MDELASARPGRDEKARVLSYLFLAGATLGFVALVFLPVPPDTSVPGTLAAVGTALLIGTGLATFGARLPEWALELALALGVVTISADIYFAGTIRTNDEMFYLWVGFYASYFFTGLQTARMLALIGVGYAVALAARAEPDGSTRWVITMGTLAVAALMVSRLNARLDRAAVEGAARSRSLREAEERFRTAFEEAPIGKALADVDGRYTQVNHAFTQLLGHERDALVGMSFRDVTHPDDLGTDEQALRGLTAGELQVYETEKRYLHAEGHAVWVQLNVAAVHDDDGRLSHFITQMQDITERKHAEAQLTHQAVHDPLTGLPNRVLFLDRLQVALARLERASTPVAVLFLDLDRFKLVNDSLGHEAGDRVLVAAAGRLRELVRPGDTVSRLGGDEFTVLCEVADDSDAQILARRLTAAFDAPFVVDGHEAFLTASVGVAVTRDHAAAPEEVLRDADAAMYRAKGGRVTHWPALNGSATVTAAERLEIESDLRRALERSEVVVHYQPEVSLQTGRITGVEALARWEHPVQGIVMPATFIPVAEESGLIVPLGEGILRAACRQAQDWRARGNGTGALGVAVNLSARQLAEPDVCGAVERALADAGLDPGALCLEITESAVVADPSAARRTLQALKDLGVRLAIDDFGVGFSSLSHIRHLPPIDVLKIDRSFVAELGRNAQDTAIVEAAIGIAHSLDAVAVAEGIETAAQADALRELGCDLGQGFHFAHPAPPDELGPWIRGAGLSTAR